jgi:Putative metal-binding motif
MMLEDGDGDGFDFPEDCDDGDALVHPGADEAPYDGVDQDCDGDDIRDVDEDGFEAEVVGGKDCDDERVDVSPDGIERCGNVRDDNCDGLIDEGCTGDELNPDGIWWSCSVVPESALWLGLLVAWWCVRWRR